MISLVRSLRALAGRFRRDTGGVAIIEFAFVLPVMVVLYCGCIAVTLGVATDRKLTIANHSLADLVAQDTEIKTTEIPDLFLAAKAVMSPYDVSDATLGMRVSSVWMKDDNNACIEWSFIEPGATKLSARPVNENVATNIPVDLRKGGTYLIWAESINTYKAPVKDVIANSIDLKTQNYMRPRQTDRVSYEGEISGRTCKK